MMFRTTKNPGVLQVLQILHLVPNKTTHQLRLMVSIIERLEAQPLM